MEIMSKGTHSVDRRAAMSSTQLFLGRENRSGGRGFFTDEEDVLGKGNLDTKLKNLRKIMFFMVLFKLFTISFAVSWSWLRWFWRIFMIFGIWIGGMVLNLVL